MRFLFTLILLISSITVYSQNDRTISLIGSYQFSDRQALSFGAGYQINAIWPKVNFESYIQNYLRGVMFFSDTDNQKIYGLRSNVYWANSYVGIGVDARLIFKNNLQRFDFGPAFKIGYKYIWLEYSANFLIDNNFLNRDSDLPTIDFNSVEHNFNLTLSIPIIKLKE